MRHDPDSLRDLLPYASPGQARIIEAIIEAGSFRAGAKALKVGERTVSAAVAATRKKAAKSGEAQEHDMPAAEPTRSNGPIRHLVIPDTQVKPGVPLDHLTWIGRYIVDKQPDVIIHLGDHWDMPSLSSYDAGKKSFEGRRYVNDVHAGNVGLDALMAPLERYNEQRKAANEPQYKPRLVMLRGNHEFRIERAIESDPKLDGLLGYHDFNDVAHGFEPVPFLQPIFIDGVKYVHFSVLNASGNVMSSKYGQANARTQLNREMCSIVTGHKQGLDIANRPAHGKLLWSLVAGSAYLHSEEYLTPQGNSHWRGVVMLNDVRGGEFEPMPITLSYLCRRYEGMELAEFLAKKGIPENK